MNWFDKLVHALQGHTVVDGCVYRRSTVRYATGVATYFERPSALVLFGHRLRGRVIQSHGNGQTTVSEIWQSQDRVEIGRYAL